MHKQGLCNKTVSTSSGESRSKSGDAARQHSLTPEQA